MTLEASGANAAPDAGSAPSLAEPQKRVWTLWQILEAMTAPERAADMPDDEFDPAAIVGELAPADDSAEAAAALRRKVDAIRYVTEEFDAYAARTDARAARLAARAKAAWNKADRIRARMLEQMNTFGFERLPGEEFSAVRKRASNPSLAVMRQPAAEDMLSVPHLVTEVPLSYAWRNDALKAALKAGATHSFAELRYSYRVDFDERDRPDVVETKKGKRK